MMKLATPVALLALSSACGSPPSPEQQRTNDAVDAAYRVCKAMMTTNLVSKCDVSGWNSSVDVRIDTNAREAIKMCSASVGLVSQYTTALSGRWKLRIFSPFSGENVLAECPF
jgi:hypothetical protein